MEWLCMFSLYHHGARWTRIHSASRLLRRGLSESKSRVIFSGIQPTGVPHIGNYLGALANWVSLQNNAASNDTLIFSVVGWHALTLPQDPNELVKARQEMLALLLAVGIDPNRSIVFHQDHNPDHTELGWILSCLTPMGKLRRMGTWKSRLLASQNKNNTQDIDESLLHVGLFTYPVLQAADILAYRSTHVPVGDDQQQHLELCDDLGDLFNRTFKEHPPLFPSPAILKTSSKRILSLRDPTSKMSKSSPDLSSRILLTDTVDIINSKIRIAITDSIQGITYDPIDRPGTSNLLTILSACKGEEDVTKTAQLYNNKNHGDLKRDVVDTIEAYLKGPREEFLRIKADVGYLNEVAAEGVRKAREFSSRTMVEVRKRVGLL